MLIGALFIFVGLIWLLCLEWQYPELPTKGLWVNYPWEMTKINVLMFGGALTICYGNRRRD